MTQTDSPLKADWFAEHNATFGDRLSAAREAAGMTASDLAKRLGVKGRTLRAWEEDLSEPRANRLSMLAGLLNVSIVWLLTGQGEGIDAPLGEGAEHDRTVSHLLIELRQIRTEALAMSRKIGHLEKQLSNLLSEEALDDGANT